MYKLLFLLYIVAAQVSASPYCEVYIIRHGQTDWNVEGRIQGHTDIPLNEEGERQALKLKEKFKDITFSAVYSSDLSRAFKTASIVAENQEITKTEALREGYMGIWEGRLVTELEEQQINMDNFTKEEYNAFKLHDDESLSEIYQRLNTFIQSQAINHLGSTILLSSHGKVFRSFLSHHDFQPEHRWHISNCAWMKFLVDDKGQISIVEFEGIESKKN